MEINATLIGQMITFAIFVWFTMRVVWPQLETALQERKKKIADGLAAAELGHEKLAKADDQVNQRLSEAKQRCSALIQEAESEAKTIIENAKQQAEVERQAIINSGNQQLQQSLDDAKTQLQKTVANLVLTAAEKIIDKSISLEDHQKLLQDVANEIR